MGDEESKYNSTPYDFTQKEIAEKDDYNDREVVLLENLIRKLKEERKFNELVNSDGEDDQP